MLDKIAVIQYYLLILYIAGICLQIMESTKKNLVLSMRRMVADVDETAHGWDC